MWCTNPLEMLIESIEIKNQPDGRVKLVDWNKKMPRWTTFTGLGANKINGFVISIIIQF